jgi:hypothetical protein
VGAGVGVPNDMTVDEATIKAAISKIRERQAGGEPAVQTVSRPVVVKGYQNPPAVIPQVTLRQAQIWSTPAGMLTNSGDYAENSIYTNWAKIKLSETENVSNARADVAFYFYYYNWQKYNIAVLGSVTAQISARGDVTAFAPTGKSSVQLSATFNVYTPPVGVTYPNSALPVDLGSVNADGNSEHQILSLTGSSPNMLSLPDNVDIGPGNYALFEVVMQVNYDIAGGSVSLDFASGDFEVTCPNVSCGLLSA